MVWGSDVEGHSLLFNINLTATILSLTGSIIMSYSCFKRNPSTSIFLKMITAIAISDVFFSIANLLSTFEGEEMNSLCYIEGFLRQSSFIMTLLFTTSLAILCSRIANLSVNPDQEDYFMKSLIFGIIICLLYVLS